MRVSVLTALLLAASTSVLHADTLFSTGFEAPTYSPGALAGQDTFFQLSGHSGAVESGIANNGTQAVKFDAATDTATNSGKSAIEVGAGFTATPADETVNIQIAAQFTSTNSGTIYYILVPLSSTTLLGQFEYFNGQVFYGGNSMAISANVWNVYGLDIDYSTNTITALVNGTVLGSSHFSSDAEDLASVSFGIDSRPGNDAAYFDDFSITTPTSVPEPSSLALLGTGAFALVGTARRRFFARQG